MLSKGKINWRVGVFHFEKSSSQSTLGDVESTEAQNNPTHGGGPVPQQPGTESTGLPPNGGLVAWTQVVIGHLLVINGFGYISSFGIFQPYYTETLGRSDSDISWIGSLQLFLLFFAGSFSGRIMDAGYFRTLIFFGCAMQILGVFATSVATQYWQLFLAQGILQGLGNGLLYTPTISLIATYFTTKRAFALGLAACGVPTGGIIYPLVARQLVSQVSFPWAVRVMGFIMLFNSIIIIAFARPRLAPRPKGPFVEWSAFRDPVYSLFVTGIFLMLWGLYFAYYYTSVFGKTVIGVDDSTYLTLLMLLNGVGVPGRLIPALLADKFWGSFNTLIPCLLFAGIGMLSWIAVHDLTGLYVFIGVYGFWANAVQALFPSALAGLTTDLSKMGTRVGMGFTIISFACLTGPPIGGALIQARGGNFLAAQIFGGSTMLLGVFILSLARWIQNSDSRRGEVQI